MYNVKLTWCKSDDGVDLPWKLSGGAVILKKNLMFSSLNIRIRNRINKTKSECILKFVS